MGQAHPLDEAISRIAILIPTYNSARYLKETLDSVDSQLVDLAHKIDLHLADDGSTDETIDIVTDRLNGRFCVSVERSPYNRGERVNVSDAIANLTARGIDWILLLHSDDVAKPLWLNTMLERIRSCDHNVASICSSWDDWYPDGTVVPGEDDASRSVERISGGVPSVRGTLRSGCWWHISGSAIRTRAFADVGGFNPNMPQIGDWEWLLRCLRRGWAVEYIPRTLILYRQHPQSVSSASLSASRDIVESLALALSHSDIMSRRQLIEFHFKRGKYVVLRIGRALAQYQFRRAADLLHLMARIGLSAVSCVQKSAP